MLAHKQSSNNRILKTEKGFFTVAYIINLILGIIMTLLALRLIFRLLAANPNNSIANFIYEASAPFVAPFFGLFNYQPQLAAGRFEFETLVAILIYGLIAALLSSVFAAPRRV